jgi:hypothetical protein
MQRLRGQEWRCRSDSQSENGIERFKRRHVLGLGTHFIEPSRRMRRKNQRSPYVRGTIQPICRRRKHEYISCKIPSILLQYHEIFWTEIQAVLHSTHFSYLRGN